MKGKGKSKGSTKVKIGIESFATLRVAEFATSSKRKGSTSSGLLKKDGKQINFKGLKASQFELERILTAIIKRKNQLEKKVHHLEAQQTKIRKRSRSTDSVDKKNSEKRPPKKVKEHTSKAHSSTLNQTKSKFYQIPFVDPHVEAPKVQKNDGPTRFWGYLEPYCADIAQDNIRAIEEWINTSKSYEKYLKIPELGKHFTSKWPVDDILEEIKEGSKSVENPKGLFADSVDDHAEAERILKQGENECSTEIDDQYAPMADRLVYSLVEENLMTAIDDTMTEACNDEVAQKTNPSVSEPVNQVKDCSLEKKLCMDFCEAGLLDADDVESDEPEDDVCRELKRLQNALIPVQEYNLLQMKKLLALAKAEMDKQEVKRKLHEVDAKVMEMYRIIAAARKNKTMNKKLEDQAKRILRERKKILEKLENMTQSKATVLLN